MTSERGGTLTRDFRVAELLEMIDEAGMVLPEFQRDFDWGDDRVIQLLATITRRWPAGSLLLQDFPGDTFYQLRAFDGGPAVNQKTTKYVVLDGQQRLTALYHAIYDAGPYVYAIRSSALGPEATIDDLEDSVRSFSRKEWDAERRDEAWSPDHDWIPFYALRSPADFYAWRDEVVRRLPLAERDDAAQRLSDAYRHGLEAFHTYAVPAVIVESELEPEAIARIFERVNRGGLTLNAFDLMVAKTYEPGWNLRERWQQARNLHPALDVFFEDDGMPLIRVVALKNKNSVREGDVLRLPGLAVRQDWDDVVEATAASLSFLIKRCGVREPLWLPYPGMVITLAALALEEDLELHEDVLVKWFLSRTFGLRYDAAANTVTVEEYHHLRRVVDREEELRQTPIVSGIVRDATRKRRAALWRGLMAALTMNGARDLLSSEVPSGDPVPLSILPRDPSPPAGSESEHLLILNLLLAERSTSRRLQGEGLKRLEQALAGMDPTTAATVRASQFLPAKISADSGQFLDQRLAELEIFLKNRVGYGFVA